MWPLLASNLNNMLDLQDQEEGPEPQDQAMGTIDLVEEAAAINIEADLPSERLATGDVEHLMADEQLGDASPQAPCAMVSAQSTTAPISFKRLHWSRTSTRALPFSTCCLTS